MSNKFPTAQGASWRQTVSRWNVCRGHSPPKAALSVLRFHASAFWSSLWHSWIKLTSCTSSKLSTSLSIYSQPPGHTSTHTHKSMCQWWTEATSTQLSPLQPYRCSNLRSCWMVVKYLYTSRFEGSPQLCWSKTILFIYLIIFITESLVCIQHDLDTGEKKTTIPILVKLTFFLIDIKLLRIRTSS